MLYCWIRNGIKMSYWSCIFLTNNKICYIDMAPALDVKKHRIGNVIQKLESSNLTYQCIIEDPDCQDCEEWMFER
jgi:hypothetical protein